MLRILSQYARGAAHGAHPQPGYGISRTPNVAYPIVIICPRPRAHSHAIATLSIQTPSFLQYCHEGSPCSASLVQPPNSCQSLDFTCICGFLILIQKRYLSLPPLESPWVCHWVQGTAIQSMLSVTALLATYNSFYPVLLSATRMH